MGKKPKGHDFAAVARRVVETAIGEHLDGTPLPDPYSGKDPEAVKRGRLGGQKGGIIRAKQLTAKQRSEIAKMAAQARWKHER